MMLAVSPPTPSTTAAATPASAVVVAASPDSAAAAALLSPPPATALLRAHSTPVCCIACGDDIQFDTVHYTCAACPSLHCQCAECFGLYVESCCESYASDRAHSLPLACPMIDCRTPVPDHTIQHFLQYYAKPYLKEKYETACIRSGVLDVVTAGGTASATNEVPVTCGRCNTFTLLYPANYREQVNSLWLAQRRAARRHQDAAAKRALEVQRQLTAQLNKQRQEQEQQQQQQPAPAPPPAAAEAAAPVVAAAAPVAAPAVVVDVAVAADAANAAAAASAVAAPAAEEEVVSKLKDEIEDRLDEEERTRCLLAKLNLERRTHEAHLYRRALQATNAAAAVAAAAAAAASSDDASLPVAPPPTPASPAPVAAAFGSTAAAAAQAPSSIAAFFWSSLPPPAHPYADIPIAASSSSTSTAATTTTTSTSSSSLSLRQVREEQDDEKKQCEAKQLADDDAVVADDDDVLPSSMDSPLLVRLASVGSTLCSTYFECELPSCRTVTCLNCNAVVTSSDIDTSSPHECAFSPSRENEIYTQLLDLLALHSTMTCPKCAYVGRKDLSCCHITCPSCSARWCYPCGRLESELEGGTFGRHNTGWSVTSPPDRCPMYLQYAFGGGAPHDSPSFELPASGAYSTNYSADAGRIALDRFHMHRQRVAVSAYAASLPSDADRMVLEHVIRTRFANGTIWPVEEVNALDAIHRACRSFLSVRAAVEAADAERVLERTRRAQLNELRRHARSLIDSTADRLANGARRAAGTAVAADSTSSLQQQQPVSDERCRNVFSHIQSLSQFATRSYRFD